MKSFLLDRMVPKVFVVVLCCAVVLAGCSFASFAAAAEQDLPVVMQMVTNITNIVAPGVSAEIQVAGGLALGALVIVCGNPLPGAAKCDPTSLVGQYQEATDAGVKQSLLQKIQAALATVSTHITAMLNLAKGISSSVGSALVQAIGVALQTITLLLSIIPVGMSVVKGGAKTSAAGLGFIPHAKTLRAQFNAAIAPQFPQAAI